MPTKRLIQTKLQPPFIRADVLPRTHLIDRLENGRYRKLTLITAPAGYGKSILGGLWRDACDCPVAWLSLDENDNDPGIFLTYIVSAMQTLFPDAFEDSTTLLNGVQLAPLDIVTESLVNETAVVPQPFLLVLDDYHLIRNPDIHQLISDFIQYKSADLHLVLITRQDPPFDIINLRARNEVTEIRLAQLRFDEAEAQQYLSKQLGSDLPSEVAHQLFQRTEGWAVGLRLAVLALRNQDDQAGFMEMYQGTNQYVMSYLVSEVLSQQPAAVQRFLLITSLLDRFCAPLCDALLKPEDFYEPISSQEILERLCQENLFLIALDQKWEWFRYHHLFQDLLRHQLKTAVTDTQVNQLHVHASSWLAQEGFIEEALDHAFSADDTESAVQIVAQARYRLINATQWQRLQQLLSRFPREVIERSIELLFIETWLFYHNGQYTKLPAALEYLSECIKTSTTTSAERQTHFLGEINALYSLLFYYAMDVDSTYHHAELAIKQVAPELWIVRLLARLFLAGAQQLSGDINGAYSTVYSSFDVEPVQGDLFRATALVTVCYVDWMTADLHSLRQNATQVVQLCQQGSPEMRGYAHYHLGALAYLQNDLATAKQHFSYVHKRPYTTYGDSFVYSSCGLALTYQAQGKEQAARDTVDAAIAYLLATGNTRMLSMMKAFQAELAYQQGQLSLAWQWASQFDMLPTFSPMTGLYTPHFTLAKIWLAENKPESRPKAVEALAQIQAFLEASHNVIHLIDILVLQVVIHHEGGDEAQAMTILEQALILAVPGSVIRPFLDSKHAIGTLLYSLPTPEPELAVFKARILEAMAPLTGQPDALPDQPLIDHLTARELDILTLLTQRQTNKEIAQTLHISLHTIHTHVKHIYTKLDVNNRRQAAIRALELGFVPSE